MESDIISRRLAIDTLNKEIIKRRLLDDVNDGMLDEFDTEDILRKLPSAGSGVIGYWILDGHHVRCNVCGMYMCNTDREGDKIPLNFCPNCGSCNGAI